jgi:asparagine synthetase B (glutamine-hydrolysing)
MCGILAAFGLADGSNKWRKDMLEMAKLLRHRGPDWVSDSQRSSLSTRDW